MKNRTSLRLFSLAVLPLIMLLQLHAAVNRTIRFKHLTNNEGLPTNTVFSTCQDYKGFIWIGTKNGLCKYDGKTVVHYDIGVAGGHRLENSTIRHIYEDSRRRLWVVAQKEVNVYDREKDLFNCIDTDTLLSYRRVVCEDRDGTIYLAGSTVAVYDERLRQFRPLLLSNGQPILANIPALAIDTRRNLWIGREHTGLIRFDLERRTKTEIRHNANDPASLPSDKIVSLYTDRNGDLWVGTLDKGVGRLDRNTGRFHRLEGMPDICVRAFAEGPDGEIWIGSEDGLYIYSPQTGKLMCHKQNYNDRYSLNDNAIYSIYRDRENNMLTGTYFGGINIYPNSFRQFFHYDYGYSERYLSGKAVRQIIGDRTGNLWIATEDGGLNYYDRSRELFRHIKPTGRANSLSYHNVHAVLEASDGMLWIGTFLGGLNRYDPATGRFTHYTSKQYEGLAFDNIFVLLEDRNKCIWIGTTNGLSVYNPATAQFSRTAMKEVGDEGIDHLLEDVEGNIWIATRTHGVYCLDPQSGKVTNYAYEENGGGLPDNCVNYVYEDSDRNIWFCTNEGGLCKLNRHTGTFTTLSERDGLPSNTIFGIIESNSGDLWISTSNGLSCLAINDYTFTNYSISEGLPNKQFNYNSVYKATDGMLFFGTINGMVAFYPEELQTVRNVAQVEFSAFRIFGKQIRPDDTGSPLLKSISELNELRLSSDQARSFALEFTVPTLSHPNSVFFATRLKGDKDWAYIGSQNHLTYANLPPGEYELSVKAAFNNKWTGTEPVKSIRIIVMPPFRQSTVAYIIYCLIAIGLFSAAFLFIKRRQEEKRAILSERLEKEKMKEINTLKLNFFTNLSHELRTPLTLILTPLQSYLEKDLFGNPQIKQKMKQVADNAQRMNNLVDELILFSKIETQQESIRVKRGDVLEFVETICQEFQSLAEEKGLAYGITIRPSNSEAWFAPVKLEKIVYNLLSNAFKYTNAGSVEVEAACCTEGEFNYLCLTVADTGVGIASNQIEHIFESYYQVNDFVNGKKTGFGIGLSLVRELVNLHKGSIRVDSELGKGTVFTVRVNISAAAFTPDEISPNDADSLFLQNYKFLQVHTAPSHEAEEQHTTGQTVGHSKLLLVEDNAELLSAYTELFSDAYTVLTADNGEEGLRQATHELPDLIVSDVMMPVMDGYRMTELLKAGLQTCHIPVILLTARTGEEAQMEGYDCGADLYIEKPFHPTLLYKQIANLLTTREHERKRYREGDIGIVEIDATEKDKYLIAKVEEIIISHLGESAFTLNDLLREAAVGRTLLHVKLKSILGLSTTEFINKVRLAESVKLLAKGKNVSEAAYATGFSSPNYYSRCFRKYYGMAPNEYVKRGSAAGTEQADSPDI